MKRRIPIHRCPGCGGPAERDCVDNFGKPYKGCSGACRIVLPDVATQTGSQITPRPRDEEE